MTTGPSVRFGLLACRAGKALGQKANFYVGKAVKWKIEFTVLAVLIAWPLTGVAQTGRDGEQPNTSPKIDIEYWRVSNECAEAAAKFWKLAGHHDGEDNAQYSNHFNRRLGKCLIKMGTLAKDDGGHQLSQVDEVYDAVEHVNLMSLSTFFDDVKDASTQVTVLFTISGKRPTGTKGTMDSVAEKVRQFKAQMDALMES